MVNSDGKILVYEWMNPNKEKNFGDLMSRDIIEHVTGKKVVVTDSANAELIAIGSVMDNFEKMYPNLKAIWGSGFIASGKDYKKLNHVVISSVRGKLSRSRVGNEDIQLGDPGLLAPFVYKQGEKSSTFTVGIVPHYADLSNNIFRELTKSGMFQIIDVRRDPQEVIGDITSKDLILSSSLHGLIISDAFNIPNYWIDSPDVVVGAGYKFEDYFSSVCRKKEEVILQDIARLTEKKCKSLVAEWKPVSDLKRIQENIKASFPLEVFEVKDKSVLVTDIATLELPSNKTKIVNVFQGENFFNEVDSKSYEVILNGMGFQKVYRDEYLLTFRRGNILLRAFYIKNQILRLTRQLLATVYKQTIRRFA